MIKTRLVGLLSHAKKYIVYTILWQWAALLSQVLSGCLILLGVLLVGIIRRRQDIQV